MTAAGKNRSAEKITDDMRHLHYVLSVKKGSRTPERRPETPSKTQREVLSAFGYRVDESGVLQGPTGLTLFFRDLRSIMPFIPETPVDQHWEINRLWREQKGDPVPVPPSRSHPPEFRRLFSVRKPLGKSSGLWYALMHILTCDGQENISRMMLFFGISTLVDGFLTICFF